MNMKQFVRNTRYLLGMTVEEFGYHIGYSSRSIYRWESGSYEPEGYAILSIIKLCKERGITLDDLVFYFLTGVSLCFFHNGIK